MPKIAYEDYYRAVMTAIEARLKPFGFARRGVNFYLGRNGNWAVVNVFRHPRNSALSSRFTVEYGIFSYSIACCEEEIETRPPIYRCHWHRRLNELWWEILDETDPDALASEVSTLVMEVALPTLLPLLTSDRKLAKAFGPTDGKFPDKYYQTILFKVVGDRASYQAGAQAVARMARNPQYRSYWKERYDRLRQWEK